MIQFFRFIQYVRVAIIAVLCLGVAYAQSNTDLQGADAFESPQPAYGETYSGENVTASPESVYSGMKRSDNLSDSNDKALGSYYDLGGKDYDFELFQGPQTDPYKCQDMEEGSKEKAMCKTKTLQYIAKTCSNKSGEERDQCAINIMGKKKEKNCNETDNPERCKAIQKIERACEDKNGKVDTKCHNEKLVLTLKMNNDNCKQKHGTGKEFTQCTAKWLYDFEGKPIEEEKNNN